jgi:hypothetical protein
LRRRTAALTLSEETVQPRHILYLLASIVLLGAACFAVLPAGAWKWLACENEGTEACTRKPLADAQFIVACSGIVPALLLVYDTARRRRRALVWLAIGAATYLAWGLLLDAAIHGWDDLKVFPSVS